MRNTYLVLLCLAFLTGCGNPFPDSESSESGSDGPDAQQGTIEGLPATKFYDQFLYRSEGGANPVHRYLSSAWIEVDAYRIGDIYAQVSLFLRDNREYVLVYHEVLGYLDGDRIGNSRTLVKKTYQGQWKLQGSDLVLGDIAYIRGTRRRGQPAVNIAFRMDIHSDVSGGLADTLYYSVNRESFEERTRGFVDLDETHWLAGSWKGKDESFEIRQRPKSLVFRNHKDVGTEPGSEFPRGIYCTYLTYATEIDLSATILNHQLQYELLYRVDRIEPVEDDRNHERCSEYVRSRQQTLLSRPMRPRLEFIRGSSDRILARGGEIFVKQ